MGRIKNRLHEVIFSRVWLDLTETDYWWVEILFFDIECTFRGRYFNRSLFCLAFGKDTATLEFLFIRLTK